MNTSHRTIQYTVDLLKKGCGLFRHRVKAGCTTNKVYKELHTKKVDTHIYLITPHHTHCLLTNVAH